MLEAAKLLEAEGYDGININCGCPSPKVAVTRVCVVAHVGRMLWGSSDALSMESLRHCAASPASSVDTRNRKMSYWSGSYLFSYTLLRIS